MPWYLYPVDLFAGAVLMNAVPHLVSGVCGARFQTPFADPPGVGESSPLVNVLWGYANLMVAVVLLWWVGLGAASSGAAMAGWAVVGLGGLLMGLMHAHLFGRVRGAG